MSSSQAYLSEKAEKVLMTSLLVRKNITVLLYSIINSGFLDKNAATKLSLLLKSTVPSYKEKEFIRVLALAEEVDQSLVNHRFYRSLVALRSLCNKNDPKTKHFLESAGILDNNFAYPNMVDHLVIFCTHLIANIIRRTENIIAYMPTNANVVQYIVEGIENSLYLTLEQTNQVSVT